MALLCLASFALSASPAGADTELLGPLRIRDMTPFNLLRLEMLPAHAVVAGPRSWAIEAAVYATLSAYDFTGGLLDGTIESFHGAFGLPTDGRDLVARNRLGPGAWRTRR